MAKMVECEVVIVGGGPVGLGLAVELGQRGVGVVLVERDQTLHTIPKGQNLTQRTMEHFRVWGIEEEIRAERVMPAGYPSAGINAYGSLTGDYSNSWFRRGEVDRFYFSKTERIPQYLTEAVLRRRVAQLPSVTALYGTEALSVAQHEDGVRVEADDVSVTAGYAVGCDGSHSLVKRVSGFGEEHTDHDRRMILIVFRSTALHEMLEDRYGQAAFFNVLHAGLGGYWRFLGRVDVGEGWFFHAPVPPGSTAESIDPAELLTETVGAGVEFEIDYLGFWDLRIAIADRYRLGRIFIAGDAAHSHPPYGGYGINTGLEDARNLGWKLAACVNGWGGDGLLDSYESERRPVFESTARDFIAAFIERDRAFIERYDPRIDEAAFAAAWQKRSSGSNRGVSVFEPHYEGSTIVFGPPDGMSGAVGEHSFDPRPGHHLPPPEHQDPDRIFNSLGAGFALFGNALDAEEFGMAADSLSIPLTATTGVAYGCGEDGESRTVLVRPDHYVSWVGEASLLSPREVLLRCTGGGPDPG